MAAAVDFVVVVVARNGLQSLQHIIYTFFQLDIPFDLGDLDYNLLIGGALRFRLHFFPLLLLEFKFYDKLWFYPLCTTQSYHSLDSIGFFFCTTQHTKGKMIYEVILHLLSLFRVCFTKLHNPDCTLLVYFLFRTISSPEDHGLSYGPQIHTPQQLLQKSHWLVVWLTGLLLLHLALLQ